jgi:hypothetical protein
VFWYSERQAQHTGISWTRGGTNYSFGASNRRYSLQFQIKFPYDSDTVYFSYGLPYTYSDLLRYIHQWSSSPLFSVSTLCRSFGGRNCPLITISKGLNIGKSLIFLTARCHPGESNGSVILHGLIDFLLSGSPESQGLLSNFVVRIVPMVCIDGVIEGNYRICLCGSDLNRMWATPDEIQHPIVWATKALLKEQPPSLYIDFHGHSRMNGTFAYGCPHNGREKLFPKIISLLSDAFTLGNCAFSMPPARLTASRCVVREEMGVLESFCIESSFCGVSGGRLASILYDEYLWKELGAKIGEAAFHLLDGEPSRFRISAEKVLGLVPKKNNGEILEDEKSGKGIQAVISKPNLSKKQTSSLPAIRTVGKWGKIPGLG